MRALGIAATGMLAQQLNVDVISNNLANLSTTGYKRQRAEFQDLMYQDMNRVGAQSGDEGTVIPTGIQLGSGVKTGGVYRINEQGVLVDTGNTFDLAVQGRGFFKVELPNGEEGYTRSGAFALSPDGEIVTQEGYVVSPGITLPEGAKDVKITPAGVVQYFTDGQVAASDAGTLDLAIFINDSGLKALGNNLFVASPASGDALVSTAGEPGYGTLQQSYLENSNVDPVKEITTLIVAQRAYEMNSKVISASDEMLRAASSLRG